MIRRSLAAAALLAALALPAQAQETACTNGQATLPNVGAFPCSNIDLVGYLSPAAFALPGLPAIEHNDIWGWTDPETGTEYALVGTRNGTGFVDLSNPTSPRLVGKLPTSNELTPPWRDIKVYRNHAFIVADAARNHGVQVFDLTRLRGMTGAPVTFQPDAVYRGIRSAHNIVINEETGFAYAVGFRYPAGERSNLGLPASCDVPGFHAIDIRDPRNPVFAGCFSDVGREGGTRSPGYTHDAQCVVYNGPDTDYVGRELCFAANEDVVTIFDVTDKQNVQIVSQGGYPNEAYTHQGWLTTDQRYFLVNDEVDEANSGNTQRTIVMDVSDLDDPEVAFIYDSGLTTIDHNLYVRGRYAFESNYEAGLRILDLGQIQNGMAQEVAFFDTFPSRTTISAPCLPPQQGSCASYNGQWSNYPYFSSGLVIANDVDKGLFVLRPAASLAVAEEESPGAPVVGYALSDPFPNPTPDGARLTLRVDDAQHVRADLYDVAGRRVASVYDGPASPAATVTLEVPTASLPAGVYLVRVTGERFEASRRLVLTR